VLADAKALNGEVAKFRKEAEKARNDWQVRQGKFDAAVRQVEELEGWGDTKAAPLRGLVDGIRTQVNERKYAPACTTLDQLLPKLKPIYDDYLKQKEAKPKYEQVLAEQSARLDPLKAAERPSQPMTAKAGEADTALQAARGKADAKDFVGGLEQMKAVKTAIDALDKLAKDPQRTKFLTDRKAVDEVVNAPADVVFKTLEADWNAILQLREQSDPMADSGDYAGANKLLADLKTKVTAYQKKVEELKKKKKAYDDALAAVQSRLTAASVCEQQYSTLNPMQLDMTAVQGQMEAAAQAEDFDKAAQLLKDLTTKLDAFEAAKKEVDKQKQEYEAALNALAPRLAEVAKRQKSNLAPKGDEITKTQQAAAASAQSGEYVKALEQTKDLATKIDNYLAEPAILGTAQNERANALLKKMSADDQKAVQKVVDEAKSEPEKQFILKGLAAGHSVAELKEFARKIQGKDSAWLRDNLSLTSSSTGTGVKQQWSMSCNATTVQAVKGQMDPLYALKLHEESPKLDQADDLDATKTNPKLAEEQKKMLTSQYKGGKGGDAQARKSGVAADGRWADDLLNNNSDVTGVTYSTKTIGAGTTVDDAIKSIDAGTSKGQPVPIVIGDGGANSTAHYVLVTGQDPGPPKRYTIHDPDSGKTEVRTEAQIKSGAINMGGGWNQIGAYEDPSTKEVK
jgi:hypothetical protein